MSDKTTTLVLPGLFGSGEQHWQSRWQKIFPDFVRVEQDDWDHPVCEQWVARLESYVEQANAAVNLLAHSLGCHTVAHWAQSSSLVNKVKGAMLVAPPDIDSPDAPKQVEGFSPLALSPMSFYTMVVASSDDPYTALEPQRSFALAWGSDFIDVGPLGHINEASNIGDWQDGQKLWRNLTTNTKC
jgi:predicted alpha/beta hydrolase family esterase